jgi:uncharacterized protein YlaI
MADELKNAQPIPSREPHGEPLEMKVQHLVKVTEHHLLRGHCPKCGKVITTDHPQAITDYEKGKDVKAHCTHCYHRLNTPGKSRLVTATTPGGNRHARRQAAVIKGKVNGS